MSIRFRLCRNEVTDMLRKTFKATPLRVPESRVQPLIVLAERQGKTDFRGALHYLLLDADGFEVAVEESTLNDVALQKTRSVDFDFGLNILEGFFQGFGIPGGELATKLKGAREIALSFNNVRRRYVDRNLLGQALRDHRIDLEHPSMSPFLGDNPYNMLLITDAIVSNSFSIIVEKSREREFSIELPEIEKVLEEARAEVKAEVNHGRSLTFEGEEFLTFAFSCIRLELDRETGKMGIGTTVVTREKAGGIIEKVEEPEPVELDDDLFEPGLLEWDPLDAPEAPAVPSGSSRQE